MKYFTVYIWNRVDQVKGIGKDGHLPTLFHIYNSKNQSCYYFIPKSRDNGQSPGWNYTRNILPPSNTTWTKIFEGEDLGECKQHLLEAYFEYFL